MTILTREQQKALIADALWQIDFSDEKVKYLVEEKKLTMFETYMMIFNQNQVKEMVLEEDKFDIIDIMKLKEFIKYVIN